MMQDSADENGCKVMTITHIYSFGPSELKRGGGGGAWSGNWRFLNHYSWSPRQLKNC